MPCPLLQILLFLKAKARNGRLTLAWTVIVVLVANVLVFLFYPNCRFRPDPPCPCPDPPCPYPPCPQPNDDFVVNDVVIDGLLASLDEAACDSRHVREFFPVERYWERYRLSDFFRGNMFRKQKSDDGSKGSIQEQWNAFKSPYEGSLADDYHKASVRHNVTWMKYTLLYQVVQKRIKLTPNKKRPGPQSLVIHLRLGDVVDGSLDSVRDLLSDQKYFYRNYSNAVQLPWMAPDSAPWIAPWNEYVRPLHFYRSKIQQMLENKSGTNDHVKSVVLMGSAHLGQLPVGTNLSATKSCQYTKALQAYVARILPRAKVSLRLGNAPDDDVVFATQAEYYLGTGGGFSRMIGTLQSMMRVKEKNRVRQQQLLQQRQQRQQEKQQRQQQQQKEDERKDQQ